MAFAEQSGHWYQLLDSGEVVARHEANLTIARKEKLYTSATSVGKMRAKPALDGWIKKAVIRAVEITPRAPGESDDSYFSRVEAVSDGKRNRSAKFGTDLHASVEKGYPVREELTPWVEHCLQFLRDNFTAVWYHEKKVADWRIGVAGTVDLVGMHKGGYPAILDWKGQSCKGNKPVFYPEWVEQLAFYDSAYRLANPMPERCRLISAAIDSDEPSPVVAKYWTEDEAIEGYRRFLCTAYTWQSIKPMGGFFPGRNGKWSPASLWSY